MTADNPTPTLIRAADTIIAAIRQKLHNRTTPLLVALDGGSGAGKSTLALLIAETLNAAHIPSDDFYAAHIADAEWDARTPVEKAADAVDWRRLRAEALEPLLAGQPARWHPFDFAALRSDGTYPPSADFVERQPARVILLDGIYSTRPELADLVDLSVLVDVPAAVRHQRLDAREDSDFLKAWHARWDAAEAYYLTYVRPKASFDLVVSPYEQDHQKTE